MLPTFPGSDSVRNRDTDSELFREREQRTSRGTRRTDEFDNFGGELRTPVPFTFPATSLHTIGFVARFGIPSKVVKPVIAAVVITVATLHLLGTRTYESRENDTVNQKRPSFPTRLGKCDERVAVFLKCRFPPLPVVADYAWGRAASTIQAGPTPNQATPYGPVIADAVAGKSGDVAVLDRRIGFGHDSLHRSGLCSEPAGVSAPVRLASL